MKNSRKAMLATSLAALILAPIAGRADDTAKLTYNKDIAPIMQKNCQECHHPGTVAPMSFLTFDEVRPWVKSIEKAVSTGQMPPFHAVVEPGVFKNDIRLASTDKEKILTWIGQGAAAGDPKDAPAPRKFESKWTIGEPDFIIRMPEPYTVSKNTEDEYKYFDVPTSFDHDVWIQAAECMPDNKLVVHHIISGLQGWAPGMPPAVFEAPYGRLLKKGAVINMQMHYHNVTGKDQVDQSSVGIRIAKYPVEKIVRTQGIANWAFAIPPNNGNHPVDATFTLPQDSHIRTWMPHMHLRGKSMKVTATFPDGKEVVMLDVPKYDFNWQMVYEYKEPIAAPKGTKFHVYGAFDNSKDNKDNPDPTITVRPGEPTTAEMMIGWMGYTVDEENAAAGKIIGPVTRERGGARASGGTANRSRNTDLVALIKQYDKNGDGKLQKDEAPAALEQAFSLIDSNADGVLTVEEAEKSMKDRERAASGEGLAGDAFAAEGIQIPGENK